MCCEISSTATISPELEAQKACQEEKQNSNFPGLEQQTTASP